MLPDVNERLVARPWPDSSGELPKHTAERRGAMMSLLERFVRGHGIRLRHDLKPLGFGSGDAELRGYFELRSQGRVHETRIFGFFARPGAFVATDFKSRADFAGMADPAWLDQRNSCETKWKALFGQKAYMSKPWPVISRADKDAYLERGND